MKKMTFVVCLLVALVAFMFWIPKANAESGFYGPNCSSCHGSTPNTCDGCHAHGTHSSSAKSNIRIIGTTNKTTYAPGETVSVAMDGGYRNGWVRAILYDQNMVELKRSSGVAFPITLTAPAPMAAGTYTWNVAWYGNNYDESGAFFQPTCSSTLTTNCWKPSTNENHGEEIRSINSFTVTAPVVYTVPNIIWRNNVTGDNAIWYLDGISKMKTSSAFFTPLYGPDWNIVGTGDFNNDGKSDILWRNASTGDNAVWFMDGITKLSSSFLGAMTDLDWKIVCAADFNADGKPDILWRNVTTGDNAVWYMNGTTMTGSAFFTALYDQNWQIVGAADLNADGKPDILWRNVTTGDNAVWYMNGTTMTGSVFFTPLYDLNWNIVGAGDYNADGKPDILWRNATTGDNAVWYMNGATMMGSTFLTPLYDPNWRIVGLQ